MRGAFPAWERRRVVIILPRYPLPGAIFRTTQWNEKFFTLAIVSNASSPELPPAFYFLVHLLNRNAYGAFPVRERRHTFTFINEFHGTTNGAFCCKGDTANDMRFNLHVYIKRRTLTARFIANAARPHGWLNFTTNRFKLHLAPFKIPLR